MLYRIHPPITMDDINDIIRLGQAGFVLSDIPLGKIRTTAILDALEKVKKNISPVLSLLIRRIVVEPDKNDIRAAQRALLTGVAGETKDILAPAGISSRFVQLFVYLNIQPENARIAFSLVRAAFDDLMYHQPIFDNIKWKGALAILDSPQRNRYAKKILDSSNEAAAVAWEMIDRAEEDALPRRKNYDLMKFNVFFDLTKPRIISQKPLHTLRMDLARRPVLIETANEADIIAEVEKMSETQKKREQRRIEARYRVWISEPNAEEKARRFDFVDLILHEDKKEEEKKKEKAAVGRKAIPPSLLLTEGWQMDKQILDDALVLLSIRNDEKALYVAEECMWAQGRDPRKEIWKAIETQRSSR